jgi:hypothetical protein
MGKGLGGPSMRCPHCRQPSWIRKSEEMTTLFREVTYTCSNTDCGHVFVCSLEVARTLSPSAIPDPEIHIPLSPHVNRRQLALQLKLALESDR